MGNEALETSPTLKYLPTGFLANLKVFCKRVWKGHESPASYFLGSPAALGY